MKLATTTADFDNYTHSHCDSFRYISRAGFNYVDLSFTKNNSFKERIFTDGWKSEVEKIKTCDANSRKIKGFSIRLRN